MIQHLIGQLVDQSGANTQQPSPPITSPLCLVSEPREQLDCA